jgi:hypothetical protein
VSRTVVIGDIHGCARALETVIRLAAADRVLVAGDVFAKGPEPGRTWRVLRDVGAEGVLGNHDARLLDVWGCPGDSPHHRAWPELDEACHEWVQALPLHRQEGPWLLVHAGVHPYEGIDGTTRKMALTMRRWPDDTDPGNPFWWQLYTGQTVVIYGHDAMRGVQIHRHSIGLDSGCVYGGKLTGFIVETGELHQADRDGNPA